MSERVTVVGSVNVDHTIDVERFPRPGETLLASSLSSSMGGKGANQAVAAAKSGARTGMIARIGVDAEGAQALESLQRAGVDIDGVGRIADAPTGSAWITVSASENTILVVPGANSKWAEGLPQFDASGVVLCQLEIPMSVVERVAVATVGTFVLNAAPASQLSDELLRHCDVLIVNEHELAEVSGQSDIDASDTDALIAASRSLIERGTTAVATTLGSKGAILCTEESTLIATTPPTPDVVDSTGAGDAFCGVFAGRLAQGESLSTALRAGVTAGSLAVRHSAAQGGYDKFARLATFIRKTPEITTRPNT